MSNKVCPNNCLGDCRECKLDEKKLKALEIIKNKQIHIARLNRCDNVLRYNMGTMSEERYLTEEEYDLLKEVML